MEGIIKVGLLTEQQKEMLIGQLCDQDTYFNPVLDCNDNWVISKEEIDDCIYPQFDWLKTLTIIDWCKPIDPDPPITGSTENY